jgi:transposase
VVPKINRNRKKAFFCENYYDHGERLRAMIDIVFVDIYKPYSELYKITRAAKYNEYDTTKFTKEWAQRKLDDVEVECKKIKKKYP